MDKSEWKIGDGAQYLGGASLDQLTDPGGNFEIGAVYVVRAISEDGVKLSFVGWNNIYDASCFKQTKGIKGKRLRTLLNS